jgi:hypothetical protein
VQLLQLGRHGVYTQTKGLLIVGRKKIYFKFFFSAVLQGGVDDSAVNFWVLFCFLILVAGWIASGLPLANGRGQYFAQYCLSLSVFLINAKNLFSTAYHYKVTILKFICRFDCSRSAPRFIYSAP